MRRILVAMSDTHAGHRLGLMPPDITLYDEDEQGNARPWTPQQTAVQQWLWRCYLEDVAAVVTLAGGDPVCLLHNGDLTQGSKYGTELVSTRKSDQYDIAVANFAPWLALTNLGAVRLSHGTGSHADYEATASHVVCQALRALHPGADVAVVRHGLLNVDGCRVDYAHHGPSAGMRQWTSGNQCRYYLRSLMNDELLRRREPPRLVVRSHFHTHIRETVRVMGDREYVSDIVVTPAYCGLSEYAQQVTRSGYLIGCGLVAAEIIDGDLVDVHRYHRVVDLRREESL